MRKTLETLISLQKEEIDRLRQIYNALLDRQDEIQGALRAIHARIEQERAETYALMQEVATYGGKMPDFASFRSRMQQEIDRQEQSLKALAPEISQAHDALIDAFAERKRFEVLQEKRGKAYMEELNTAEQQRVDENTILRYQRILP